MESTHTASLADDDGDPGPTPAHLVLAHTCHAPLAAGTRIFLRDVDKLVVGRGAQLDVRRPPAGQRGRVDVAVADDWVSREHVEVTHELSHWQLADLGSKNGTLVNGAPVATAALQDGDVLTIGRTFWVFRDALVEPGDPLAELDSVAAPDAPGAALHTFSAGLGAAFHRLRQVAASPVSVLVSGETGTGKELVSRAVHGESGRRGPFVAVNCGALPRTLIEAELFGVKRGAFTGASEDRPGLIRAAAGGTLFLDEIGELPLEAQAVLLRVLEEREVTPVGATAPVKVDVRVVAATNRNLDDMVRAGTFRHDLLARLTGFRIPLPPLIRRREDLGLLLAAALRRAAPDRAARLAVQRDLSQWLFGYAWPGNIRELVQVVATLCAVATGSELRLADLPDLDGPVDTILDQAPPDHVATVEEPADQRALLEELLLRHHGNTAAVARDLGTSRSQVRRLARRYQLDLDAFREVTRPR